MATALAARRWRSYDGRDDGRAHDADRRDDHDARRRRAGRRAARATCRRRRTDAVDVPARAVRPRARVRALPGGLRRARRSPADQVRAQRRLVAGGAPIAMLRNVIGYGMVAPTIVAHGTDAPEGALPAPAVHGRRGVVPAVQRAGRGLGRRAACRCARSATATSGSSTARRSGRRSRTSSRFGLLLARTDPDVAKHAGHDDVPRRHARRRASTSARCTRSPARPSSTSASSPTRTSPTTDRLGGVGEGWHVAITTLMNERVSIGGNAAPRGSGPIGEAVRLYKERFAGERRPARSQVLRDEVLQAWVRTEVAAAHQPARVGRAPARAPRARRARSPSSPSPRRTSGSTTCASTCMGADGMLYSGDFELVRPDAHRDRHTGPAQGVPPRARELDRGRAPPR